MPTRRYNWLQKDAKWQQSDTKWWQRFSKHLQIKTATNKGNKLTTKRCKWLQRDKTIRNGCKTSRDTKKAQKCAQNIRTAIKRLKLTTKRKPPNSQSGGSSWRCGVHCLWVCSFLSLYSILFYVFVTPVTRRISESHRYKEKLRGQRAEPVKRKVESETKDRGRQREMDNKERQSRIFHHWNISHFT